MLNRVAPFLRRASRWAGRVLSRLVPRRRGDDVLSRIAKQAPDDPAARAAFAAQLVAQGEPLGSFMQLQCARAECPPGRAQAQLMERERALFDRHAGAWTRGLPPGGYFFAGGLIDRVDCAPNTWRDSHRAIRERGRVRQLSLSGLVQADAETYRALAFTNLEKLELDHPMSPQELIGFTANRSTSELRALRVRSSFLGDDQAVALASTETLPALESLELEGWSLTYRGVEALLSSPRLTPCQVTFQRLRPTERDFGKMVAAGHLAKRADCRTWEIGARHLEQLLTASASGAGYRQSASSGLTYLGVPCERISDDGARGIAQWPAASSLEELCMTGTLEEYGDRKLWVGDPGFLALCASPHFKRLVSFSFGGPDAVTLDASRAIWAAPWLARLSRLELKCNVEFAALATAVRDGLLDNLEHLWLPGDDDRVGELFLQAELPRLRSLRLFGFPGSTFLRTRTRELLLERFGTMVELYPPGTRWKPRFVVSGGG